MLARTLIDQLPETEETLWLRILGRGETQARAIREVLNLPPNHPRRDGILRLLISWTVKIDLGEIESFTGQEGLMAFSEAFLEWEQQTQERIRQNVLQEVQQQVIPSELRSQQRAIARRFLQQELSIEVIAHATELSVAEIQNLQPQE